MMIAMLLFATIPLSPVQHSHVDLVEHHTRCDDEGCPKFKQWIMWRWNAHESRHEVVAWLTDNGQVQREGNAYIFHRFSVLYRVTSDHYRETITQNDPERMNAEVLPPSKRRGLWGKP